MSRSDSSRNVGQPAWRDDFPNTPTFPSAVGSGCASAALSLAARAGPYGGAGPFDHLAPQAWRQGHAAAAVNPALRGSSRERAPDPDKMSEETSNGVNNHWMYSYREVEK